MNPMYYILIGVIVLVVAIDFYVKNKNKKSDSIDIDKFKESPKKKKKNSTLFISLAFLFTILSAMIFLHIQHQSVRNQFETNLESISELLENHKYDYCDSIVKQNKTDLINNSNANKLKYNFNVRYYNSSDLIYSADSLIKLIAESKKDYAIEKEKRKKKEQERKLRKEINSLIDSFIRNKDKKFKTAYGLWNKEEYQLWKDLFPILYKILELDKKNKFALFHLGDISATITTGLRFNKDDRQLCYELLFKAEEYATKLLKFYPKYWGGDKIFTRVNNMKYQLDKTKTVNLNLMRSYATNVIEKIGVPKNNWEKAVLLMIYQDRAFSNEGLRDYRAVYYDALYLSKVGEIFVDKKKYLESKVYTKPNNSYVYFWAWDPIDYQDYK